MTRRLVLRKETSPELTADELALVAGGNTAISEPIVACFGVSDGSSGQPAGALATRTPPARRGSP